MTSDLTLTRVDSAQRGDLLHDDGVADFAPAALDRVEMLPGGNVRWHYVDGQASHHRGLRPYLLLPVHRAGRLDARRNEITARVRELTDRGYAPLAGPAADACPFKVGGRVRHASHAGVYEHRMYGTATVAAVLGDGRHVELVVVLDNHLAIRNGGSVAVWSVADATRGDLV